MPPSPLIALFTAIALASWAALAYSLLRMIRHLRPGISPWRRDLLWNPLALLCRPDVFTAEGGRYRQWAAVAFGSHLAALAWAWLLVAWSGR
jgi:hypothetical protein